MDDSEQLHVFFADPVATRFWDTTHETLEKTRAFVSGTMAGDPAEVCDFVIERQGRVVGKAGMWKKPDIGFFVLPLYQRQGYAREALSAIIPHLFDAYKINALTADVDPDNTASIALLTALGFHETHRRERTIEIRGVWCDSVYFALERTDWSAI